MGNKLDTGNRLVRAHRFLAILLGLFILSHLAVHVTALGGPERHIKSLDIARLVYKNLLIEPVLILAVIVQVALGARLVGRRWKQEQKSIWGWTQIFSGLYLGFFLLIHSSAALYTKYGTGLDTNFYWAAGTVNITPLKYGFMPYYFLGITSVFAHLAAALHFGWPDKGKRVAPFILVFGMGLAALIVAIFAGAFYDITIPQDVIDNFEKYMPW